MLIRPIETECRAPIVDDEDDFVAESELFPQSEKKAPMFRIGVTVGSGIRQLGRVAHPDEVTGDEAAETTAGRHHIAPEIGRGRVAMLEDDRGAFALINIGHAMAVNLEELLFGEWGA